jgi:hypothetical protein
MRVGVGLFACRVFLLVGSVFFFIYCVSPPPHFSFQK